MQLQRRKESGEHVCDGLLLFLTIIILITPHASAFYSPSLTFPGLALYRDLIWPVLLQLAWGLTWLWDLLRVAQLANGKTKIRHLVQYVWFPPEHWFYCLLGNILGGSIRQRREEFIPYAKKRDTKDFENEATQSKFCLSNSTKIKCAINGLENDPKL